MEPVRPRTAPLPPALLRRIVTQTRRPGTVVTLAVVVVVAVVVGGLARQASAERAAWGDTVAVPRLRHPVPAGVTLTAADVDWVDVPLGLAPADPVDIEVAGRRLRADAPAGRLLSATDLASGGPVTGRLAPGRRAVELPDGPVDMALVPGDRVELVSVSADLYGELPAAGSVLTSDAVVVTVSERSLVVSVPADHAVEVAVALAGSTVIALALPA